MLHLSLQHGYSISTLVWVTTLAIALVALFYWKAFRMLKPRQWRILLALRILAILTIVLLLFRPVLSGYQEPSEQRSVIFLVDTSLSMSITDDSSGKSRIEQAREHVGSWAEELREAFKVYVVEFSESPRQLRDPKQISTLTADGKATSISGVLSKVTPRKDIEAIFLVSDGVHNSAGDPTEIAAGMRVTVHSIGVGASLRNDPTYRDIQVASLNCQDKLMVNNQARITAGIEGVELAGRVIRVILDEDDTPVAEAELTLDDLEGHQEVEFEFRPTVLGRHVYTVRVPPIPEEKIEENNQRSAVANVVEPGIRVLYLEGTLRTEYKAIAKRFLAKDPDLESCSLVQNRPNEFQKYSDIEGLDFDTLPTKAEQVSSFDVFILGDLDSSYFKQDEQNVIVQRVREGAGLIMLGGYHSLGPGGYAGTPIGEILPVFLGNRDIGQVPDPFLPVLTPDGNHHPIFANIADFFPTTTGEAKVGGLPDLNGCTRVRGARPGATVLATCPLETTAQGAMPVLAIQPVDKGRTAVFCGDTTFNWQQGPVALGQDTPFIRFWGQLIRWAASRSTELEAGASVSCKIDKAFYEPDEEVVIRAIVRDEKGEGAPDAEVSAEIRSPARRTKEIPMSLGAGTAGHYEGSYTPAGAGSYEIVVRARLGDTTLESEPSSIEVGRPYLEFENLDLNEALLAEIAANTGGRYVHISTADNLIEQLDRTERKRRVRFETPLAVPLPLWIFFVGIVTTEWVLRRRFQLR